WVAENGEEAVRKCAEDTPDIVLMDLIMPVMDGVQATREIMKRNPCAILVVTATVTGNASMVFEAMGYGALDAAGTPVMGTDGTIEGSAALLKKIATIGKLIGINDAVSIDTQNGGRKQAVVPLAAIGSSTGGPKAIATILAGIHENFGGAIVVIQHVDYQFAEGFSDWLNEYSKLPVRIAAENHSPATNNVYVARTNDHLVIGEDLKFHYTAEPLDYPYRPSVDAFFQSLAVNWPEKGIAALLTGIGKDGAKGLLALRKKGWLTIAQDRESSIVYGMPKAAAELDAAVETLPLDRINDSIVRYINKKE
ncbi:MAG: chemotaxis-specific protein-glutamate methyltransferase CheB, partial [Candidatus Latescibacteria bacterium]|nr:chemotaxis-specific protein-glutamate methyltransferase CheB [Candidatus Latescibacterota bacterium]